MSNEQLYIAVAFPSAIAFMDFLTTLVGFLVQNKRLDDMRDDMKAMRLTLDAVRQDMADVKAGLWVHEAEITNLKDRLKA